MRVEPSSPPDEFVQFCDAVRTWLKDVALLDPALAAVADLVAEPSFAADGVGEQQLIHQAADTADVHSLLGARALLSLWSGFSR